MQIEEVLLETAGGGRGLRLCQHTFQDLKTMFREKWDGMVTPQEDGSFRLTAKGMQLLKSWVEISELFQSNPHFLNPQRLSDEEHGRAKRLPRALPVAPRGSGVYLLKSASGIYKIGCTHNLVSRMSSLWGVLPEDFEVFAFFPTDGYRSAEHYLHVQYQKCRVIGEWFALTETDVADLLSTYRFLLINKPVSEFLKEAIQAHT